MFVPWEVAGEWYHPAKVFLKARLFNPPPHATTIPQQMVQQRRGSLNDLIWALLESRGPIGPAGDRKLPFPQTSTAS